ncbi:hypothetical protein ACTQ49_08550 [Luteococcus sp. Sow4_B9]|uniref:hypothetical protein n=1 Tax=Luteococcus sp. Sow4_B9 TaxID=3438792 RepID=UPI003F9B3C9A
MKCTLLVNIWNVQGGPRLQAEVSAQEVEFASIPASGDRLRAGSLGAAMGSLMGLPTIDRVEHAPRLPFEDGGHRTARTVVVVNLALSRELATDELDRIVDAGWTVIQHGSLRS